MERNTHARRLACLAAVVGLMSPALATADINGFGNFSNFTVNNADGGSSPTVSIPSDSINLINGYEQNRSIFCNTPQPVSKFTASFTFTGIAGDGACLVIQNSPAGTSAVGTYCGYSGVTKSIAIKLDNGNDTGVYTNGTIFAGGTPTSPVNLFSGDPIDVNLSYNGSILSESLEDTTNGATFSTSYLEDIPTIVGSSSALVGLCLLYTSRCV